MHAIDPMLHVCKGAYKSMLHEGTILWIDIRSPARHYRLTLALCVALDGLAHRRRIPTPWCRAQRVRGPPRTP